MVSVLVQTRGSQTTLFCIGENSERCSGTYPKHRNQGQYIKFLVAFGKFYFTPGYNWQRKNDLITGLYAHSSHEVLVQVFTMKNKIQSLINDGCKTNTIFKYCYTNLTRLSHDESYLSEVTTSPQNSTFNQFNGFLDRSLKNMMQKPCSGRWIGKRTPHGLASTNTKAVQLLAKTIVAKLNNEEYSTDEDGRTGP